MWSELRPADTLVIIILNDFLYSNYVVYKAFFEKGHWDRKKMDSIINYYNGICLESLSENYFSKNFGAKYFSKKFVKSNRVYQTAY